MAWREHMAVQQPWESSLVGCPVLVTAVTVTWALVDTSAARMLRAWMLTYKFEFAIPENAEVHKVCRLHEMCIAI